MWRFCCIALCVLSVSSRTVDAAPETKSGGGHAEHIGEAHAGPQLEDPTEIRADLAVWSLVVFLLLLAILYKFAWGPIAEGLDKRERRIAENIEAAERAGEEARRTMAEYQAKLASAADEVRAMLDEARRDAENTKQEIVAEARTAAAAEHDRQMREIRTATDSALKQLAENSATLATELAGKIIRQKLNPQDHQKLIREAVEKFAAGQPSRN
jgi:F-type H+-transporting ATPase subunit b